MTTDGPSSPTSAEASAPRRTFTPRVVVESLLIVFSVLLGFAANAWREQRTERKLASEAIANFSVEIHRNLAQIERAYPVHLTIERRLEAAAELAHGDSTAYQVLTASVPESGPSIESLADAAWQTAASTGALRLLDYDLVAHLSATYELQHGTIQRTVDRLEERLSTPTTFEPASRTASLRALRFLVRELSGQEWRLREEYRASLVRLERQQR